MQIKSYITELYQMLETISEMQNTTDRIAYSVDEISEMTTLSRAFLRNEIRANRLNATKFGRRVLIMKDDLQAYLEKGSKGRREN